MTFEEARAQFPVLERYAYLNAGTNGPLARATVEAITEWNERDLEQGRGGKAYFEQILAFRDRAREELAGVLEVAPENVALVSSTTNASGGRPVAPFGGVPGGHHSLHQTASHACAPCASVSAGCTARSGRSMPTPT